MNITVHHSELTKGGTRLRVSTEVTDTDGTSRNVLHIMPAETIEWRVAQLNVTPEVALDTILAEPYAELEPNELDLQPTRSGARNLMAARAKAAVDSITYQDGPPPDGIGPSIEAEADSGDGDPKAFLLEWAPVDDAMIEAKRELMDRDRAVTRDLAVQPEPEVVVAGRRDVEVFRALNDLPPPRVTEIVETPSELAERLIASRLEMVRTSRNVST